MKAKFNNIKISGLSVVVPEKEINIYDEAQYYDNSVKKIDRMRKMVGFHKRRVCDYETTPTDLAYDAAKNLIAKMEIDVNSIDALLFVVQQPDYVNPACAYFLHDKLGLSKNCFAMDINQGCVGWVYGLFVASQMIASKTVKRVLLLNGDTPTPTIDIANRTTAPLFGDAGCATLIDYSEENIPLSFNIETISSGFESLIRPYSGTRFRLNYQKEEDVKLIETLRKEKYTSPNGIEVSPFSDFMDGMAVFDFTVKFVPNSIRRLMEYVKLSEKDINMLCLHQANKQIIQTICSALDFPLEKAPYQAFENYGNNTMCSIPTTISLLDTNIPKENLLCSGFGNGLVCASALLNMKDTKILDIKTFEKPFYVKKRDEYIKYWEQKFKGEI